MKRRRKIMKLSEEQARRYAGAFLRTMDPVLAGRAIGQEREDFSRDKGVLAELEAQRRALDGQIRREDVVRRLGELAFGRPNDCVRLVLEEKPEVEKLDLSLLSEIKRSEKGALELKLLDRLAVLEQLAALTSKEDGTMELLQALGNAGEAL